MLLLSVTARIIPFQLYLILEDLLIFKINIDAKTNIITIHIYIWFSFVKDVFVMFKQLVVCYTQSIHVVCNTIKDIVNCILCCKLYARPTTMFRNIPQDKTTPRG